MTDEIASLLDDSAIRYIYRDTVTKNSKNNLNAAPSRL